MVQVEAKRFRCDRPDVVEKDSPAEVLAGKWEEEYRVVRADLHAAESVDDFADVIRTAGVRGGTAGRHEILGEWERKWYELKHWGMIAVGIRVKGGIDNTKIEIRDLEETSVTVVEMDFDTKPTHFVTKTYAHNLRELLGAEGFNDIFGSCKHVVVPSK